jgi:uncharacterized protein (DUF983 family)
MNHTERRTCPKCGQRKPATAYSTYSAVCRVCVALPVGVYRKDRHHAQAAFRAAYDRLHVRERVNAKRLKKGA